jgi:hypothetical protein
MLRLEHPTKTKKEVQAATEEFGSQERCVFPRTLRGYACAAAAMPSRTPANNPAEIVRSGVTIISKKDRLFFPQRLVRTTMID